MEITRLTLPSFPAVSSSDLESWLRIDPNQDAATLAMLVASATEYVEGLTGLCLGSATYRVSLDSIATSYRLPIAPIQAIAKVECWQNGALTALDGWRLENGWLLLSSVPASPPVVTLSAGYADPSSVPQSLAHAIAVLVSAGYNTREEISDLTAKTIDRLCQRHKRISW